MGKSADVRVRLKALTLSYGKFLVTSSVVGCVSFLIVYALRYELQKHNLQATYIAFFANSCAYFFGTLMSYLMQIRFVHRGASLSRRGLVMFFPGQLLISLLLGVFAVKIESLLIHRLSMESTPLALMALAIALLLMAPISFLFGRHCTTLYKDDL